jgi:protein-arginine kinase activator protein McsA
MLTNLRRTFYFSAVTDTWVIQEDELDLEEIFLSDTRSVMVASQRQKMLEENNATSSSEIQAPVNTVSTNLQTQIPRGRTSQKAVKCPQCGKGYSNNGNLMRHLKFECGKEPQFHCPLCPLRTRHKSNLLSHIYCKHPTSIQNL